MNIRLINRGQRGFSLLELVITIALAGIITTAITVTLFQVFNMNTRTSNRMAAVSQVQNAGKIVSQDILQAQNVTATESPEFSLTLQWTDPASGNRTTVVYTLVNMPTGTLKRLQRTVTVTPPQGQNTTTVSIVAEYIEYTVSDPTKTSCRPLGLLPSNVALNFTVTATVGRESETRLYQVKPRPG